MVDTYCNTPVGIATALEKISEDIQNYIKTASLVMYHLGECKQDQMTLLQECLLHAIVYSSV